MEIMKSVPNFDCLICGEISSNLIKQEDNIFSSLESEEKNYASFIKHFAITRKKSVLPKYSEWKDGVPFCTFCKGQLSVIGKLQDGIDKLTCQLNETLKILKDRIDQSEEAFRKKEIYNDSRYKVLRAGIISNKRLRVRVKKEENVVDEQNTNVKLQRAYVKLSARDKSVADDHFQLTLFKPEPVQDFVFSPSRSVVDNNPDSEDDNYNDPNPEGNNDNEPEYDNYKDPNPEGNNDNEPEDDNDNDPLWEEPSRPQLTKRVNEDPYKDQASYPPVQEDDISRHFSDNDPRITVDLTRSRPIFNNPDGSVTYCTYNFLKLPSGKYQCTSCSNECDKATTMRLKEHLFKYHTNVYACPNCSYRAGIRHLLLKHIASSHDKVRKDCHICGRPVAVRYYKAHLWSHKNTEERAAALASGGTIFVPKGVLDANKTIKQYHCDLCSYSANRKVYLTNHLRNNHISPEELEARKQVCPECGLTFANLRHHLKITHKQGYICNEVRRDGSICKISRPTPRSLQLHKDEVHNKVMAYQCTLCPRQFSVQQTLKKHLDSHNQVRKFQCESCGVKFMFRVGLRTHMKRYHTEGVHPPKRKPTMINVWAEKKKKPIYDLGDRKWKCDHCESKFNRKYHLQRHVGKYHTEGVPKPKIKAWNLSNKIIGWK